MDRTEQYGASLANTLLKYIERRGGRFVRDEDRGLQIILDGRRIPINFDRENVEIARLMIEACHVTTLSQSARAAIQRLQIKASEQAARIKLCRFSGTSVSGERIYIPSTTGNLLCIGLDSFEEVPNGENEDGFWIEHPCDEPLDHAWIDPREGLALFERLLVETQACARPEMRWLVAMQMGIFPYIRTLFPARFILELRGPSQSGKTSGAQRFTYLHGLGEVKGDCSVAALNNEGDIGLLVLDNREQANFEQSLIDFCLYLATGAQRQRSNSEGKVRTARGRPVGVITTIEGVPKRELQTRTITTDYRVTGEQIERASIEREIRARRHEILSAITWVLAAYLRIRGQRPTPNPRSNLSENFQADADLLRAFEEIAGKPKEWAEPIIASWAATIVGREPEENELEHPICRVVEEELLNARSINLNWRQQLGTLYVTTCGGLLSALQKLNLRDHLLPTTPEGLGRRLRSAKFCSFELLDEQSETKLPVLRRKGNVRPIGLFFPSDG